MEGARLGDWLLVALGIWLAVYGILGGEVNGVCGYLVAVMCIAWPRPLPTAPEPEPKYELAMTVTGMDYESAAALRRTMEILRSTNPSPAVLAVVEKIEAETDARQSVHEWERALMAAPCHCGEPVVFGFDGNPENHRGMCAHCDAVRCDAYPGACT